MYKPCFYLFDVVRLASSRGVKACFSFLLAFLLLACEPVALKIETSKDKASNQDSAWQTASGEPVEQGRTLVFPQDHGIHQVQGIEWWYLTANLTASTGETFGVQWTLFRTLMPIKTTMPIGESVANRSKSPTEPSANSLNQHQPQPQIRWWDNNLYFAHFAMQHQQRHVAFERFARVGQASVQHSPFVAEIDNWQLASQGNEFLPLRLKAAQGNYQLNISLADSPLVLHGDEGYSQKTGAGHASYYYSYPFLTVDGQLTFAGKQYQVSGNAWYDREWSASLLSQEQLGWDWFSLVNEASDEQLSENDAKGLMVFCIRGAKQNYDYCSGSKITKNGKVQAIHQGEVTLKVLATVDIEGDNYPKKWQIELPDTPAIFVESITQDSRNQLTFPYWEGRVKASGGFSGLGYAELTGY
ncbi:ABC transporter [Thalassotalea euphylliae]|uniref:ABC transporter n=1 Tax=Thalassotalea euphylliae TaxID=1655234 RepID=A0A3E0TSZ4_9GAMM|nr:lipocalin-like domain-containing protein [Thalassotalea euphylliae]REL27092.1 ABC transporter [Thalassotalea euphylliae]